MEQVGTKALTQMLQEALGNLYNPLYSPPEDLLSTLRIPAGSFPKAMVEAIHAMRPDASVPDDAAIRRYHQLLCLRYVEGLTQEATAERMGISTRYLRDIQRLSVQALATHMLEKLAREAQSDEPPASTSQIARELVSLEQTAPRLTASVGESLRGALSLVQMLECMRSVHVELVNINAETALAIHPSALKQVLVRGLEELGRRMPSGRISVSTEREAPELGSSLQIAMKATPAMPDGVYDLALMDDILTPHGGSVRISHGITETVLDIAVPTAEPARVHVLVVDDNDDLVTFYRAYAIGTVYDIEQVREGGAALPFAASHPLDLIVLDVMLPDMDGWELLIQLRDHPLTRATPVVVCSVIRDEELAHALGAVGHVPKPVGRRAFLSALNQAMAASRSPCGR